jgi:hypothetical protein
VDTGELSRGILLPQAFGQAIKAALAKRSDRDGMLRVDWKSARKMRRKLRSKIDSSTLRNLGLLLHVPGGEVIE